MLNVYCIPGMGVNERLFRNLKLNNCNILHIKWETPFKGESLADYAMRLAGQIDTSKPFALIGVSFGGMCATEIAKKLKVEKVFIVSSCKLSSELPRRISILKWFPVYKFFHDGLYKNAVMLARKQFGVITEEQKANFKKMLEIAPANYYNGAVNCIATWKNDSYPETLVHIHGTADKVLPYKRIIKCDHMIKGGTHFMILNRAAEISEIINKELEELTG